jgi:hypothetical protein
MNITKINVAKEDKPIVEIIAPNMVNGPWIAGGACIHWLRNEGSLTHSVQHWTDIDIYCSSTKQIEEVLERMLNAKIYDVVVSHDSNNAVSLHVRKKGIGASGKLYTIQIIKKTVYNTPEDVINDFDIIACKIISDGNDYIAADQTLADIYNKVVRIEKLKPESSRRLLKYLAKGYSLDADTYKRLGEQKETIWSFGYTEDDY